MHSERKERPGSALPTQRDIGGRGSGTTNRSDEVVLGRDADVSTFIYDHPKYSAEEEQRKVGSWGTF